MEGEQGRRWLGTAEAAARLGVQPATLYAYVSRGIVGRHRPAGGRESRFDAAEIERLAARTRRGGRAGGLELVMDSALTLLDPAGGCYYRGLDVTRLCRTAAYEDVAEWLWLGGAAIGAAPAWPADERSLPVARAAAGLLPAGARPVDRLLAAVAAMAPLDPLRHDRRPAAVAACARSLIATVVECLPAAGLGRASVSTSHPRDPESPTRPGTAGGRRPGALAARLWPKLCAAPATPVQLAALNGALVLLADHELAASTLAARVAASTWADPYRVVLAGLGTLDGPLHGRASDAVLSLLADAAAAGALAAVGARLRSGDLVPGFGHKVYTAPDPRGTALLALVEEGWAGDPKLEVAHELLDVMAGRGGPHPNVDFALATLAWAAGMDDGAGEAVFAVARVAGWVAHAVEEYAHALRYRPRAVYVGPAPLPD